MVKKKVINRPEAPITMRHRVENNKEVFLTPFKVPTTEKMPRTEPRTHVSHSNSTNALVFTLEVDRQTLPGHSTYLVLKNFKVKITGRGVFLLILHQQTYHYCVIFTIYFYNRGISF